MKCLYCGCLESKVIDSRTSEDGETIRRRRECLECGKRFSTYEKVEGVSLAVIKKDGSRQPFDRNKLIMGLMRACEKRPIGIKQLEKVVDSVENKIYEMQRREITSEEIGDLILTRLRDIDAVAYVRFASVYREFKDIQSFFDELQSIINDNTVID
ncbi:MAG: transcriptional regulator NrdR [Eubacteriales bacterium]|nr:transcriptional regulator NrdR [Eubacteriales bacterium]